MCLQNTLWEGGTRAAAFIHGSLLSRPGTVSRALVHVTDWLPTLVSAAGADIRDMDDIDGVDQWEELTSGRGVGKRRTMLYNIDPLLDPVSNNGNNAAIRSGRQEPLNSFVLHIGLLSITSREGNYKLIVGDPGKPDGWIPPPLSELESKSKEKIPLNLNTTDINHKRTVLLFDLNQDPSEKNDLSRIYPNIVRKLKRELK